jgi:CRISPR-associated protein Csb2
VKMNFCIHIRFIHPHPLFHGVSDGGDAEWPPSPMRVFQAILNAASLRARGSGLSQEVQRALQFLEGQRPQIIAPPATQCEVGYRAYVPHNQGDLVTAAWHRGRNEESIASHRVEKDHRPMRLQSDGEGLPTVSYVYSIDTQQVDTQTFLESIRPVARSIYCLGWGIDQVVADAEWVDDAAAVGLLGERFTSSSNGSTVLRTPRAGALEALQSRYTRFVNRLVGNDWTPVPPVTCFEQVRYRRDSDPPKRPYAVFKLVDENDDTVSYPQSKFIHIAGMTRHLAKKMMERTPPRNLRGRDAESWVNSYVLGHRSHDDQQPSLEHTQFSYIPLQSIGMEHTDPSVRRVMIVAPVGDEDWLEYLATRIDDLELEPMAKTRLPPGTRLERIDNRKKDGVRDAYTQNWSDWASVTPVILPGHDDHKPEKTVKLILKALSQSGIDQECVFEWSAYSHFRKMLGAHKYVRDVSAPNGKRMVNYIRPDHLLEQSAVHLKIQFPHPVPGPIAIGAGRHCGFGLMAGIGE